MPGLEIKTWEQFKASNEHFWEKDDKPMRAQFFHSRGRDQEHPYRRIVVVEALAPREITTAVVCEDDTQACECWDRLVSDGGTYTLGNDPNPWKPGNPGHGNDDPIKEIKGPGLGIGKDDKLKGPKGNKSQDPINDITGPGTNLPAD